LAVIGDWNAFLNRATPEEELRNLRRHGRTGRPLGDDKFVEKLEEMLGRVLKPKKRGPKPKGQRN
jgi:putative transposase